MRKSLVWTSLFLGCMALLSAMILSLAGCAIVPKDKAYRDVVEELNQKYGTTLSVDLKSRGELTPEQFRAHLEGVILAQQAQA